MEVKPFDSMISLGATRFIDQPIANVGWILNIYCNYNCSYCWPWAHQSKKDFKPEHMYIASIHEIVDQFEHNGFTEINWSFAGGEPTFNPSFIAILNEIQSFNHEGFQMSSNLVTNLSQSPKFWYKFIQATKQFKSIYVNGSLHLESINTDDKLHQFMDKMKILRDNDINIKSNLVLVPGQLQQIQQIHDKMIDNDLILRVKGCKVDNKLHNGYTGEELSYLSSFKDVKPIDFSMEFDDGTIETKHSFENIMAMYGARKFKGWMCTAGYRAINIFPNGQVTRGAICSMEEPDQLGNIFQGTFQLLQQPKPCETGYNCTCIRDAKMPKWKV